MTKKNKDGETPTQHGHWTPATSKAADREMEKLKDENPFSTTPPTESQDKTRLNVPQEQHGGEH